MKLEIIRRNGSVVHFSIDPDDYEKIKGYAERIAFDGTGHIVQTWANGQLDRGKTCNPEKYWE
jgi:hypothetical protein